MNRNEIALQLTLKAMDLQIIPFVKLTNNFDPKASDKASEYNLDNAKYVYDFYDYILKSQKEN